MDFVERDQYQPVPLELSLAGNLKNYLCPSADSNGGSVAMDSVERKLCLCSIVVFGFHPLPLPDSTKMGKLLPATKVKKD